MLLLLVIPLCENQLLISLWKFFGDLRLGRLPLFQPCGRFGLRVLGLHLAIRTLDDSRPFPPAQSLRQDFSNLFVTERTVCGRRFRVRIRIPGVFVLGLLGIGPTPHNTD